MSDATKPGLPPDHDPEGGSPTASGGMRCLGCGYELVGLGPEVTQCPECGRSFDPRDPATMGWMRLDSWRRGVLAWAVLLVLIAGVMVLQRLGTAPAGSHVALPDPAEVASPMLKVSGQLAIGLDRYSSAGGSTGAMVEREKLKMLGQLDDVAEGPIDQLRIVPLAGWIAGRDAALDRLKLVEDEMKLHQQLDAGFESDIAALRTLLNDGSEALDAAARDELVRRHGWFAEVGLAHDRPSSDPQRRALVESGASVLLALVGAGLVAFGALITGFIVLVVLLVKIESPWMRARYPRDRGAAGPVVVPYVEVLAIFLAGFLLLSLVSEGIKALTGIEASRVLMWLLLLAALWPLARGVRMPQLRRALGWHTGEGVAKEIFCGLTGYLAGLPLVALSFVMSFILIALFHSKPSHPVVHDLAHPTVWAIITTYILATMWAPIVEETMFRGAFYHHLRGRLAAIPSALIAGLVFAIIHPQGLALVPPLMMLGAVFAMIREWRGSLIGSVVAHAMHNGFLITLMVIVFS